MKEKIFLYCFPNGGGYFMGIALAEDGNLLNSHLSSTKEFSKKDLSRCKSYELRYPDGYELVWVDDPDNHPGLLAALAKNKEIHDKGIF